MPFSPQMMQTRFGFGLSPRVAGPGSLAEVFALLGGPDEAAARWPVPSGEEVRPSLRELRDLNRARRDAAETEGAEAATEAFDAARLAARDVQLQAFKAQLSRAVASPDAFRERLVRFWADHFTVRARNGFTRHLVSPYVEEAIRPHVTGRFADMLVAVTTHPMMLDYLDQGQSMGPNSIAAERRDRGMNENLARELLELHTVGVDGPYGQTDVRELAELLTGLAWHPDRGTSYQVNYAEPGAETVLGVTYSDEAAMSTVTEALRGLADHPATHAHLARKLAVHFVSDAPSDGRIAALTEAFSGGLMAVYAALLNHPDSWQGDGKVKPPFDYVASACRALDVPEARIAAMTLQEARRGFQVPLQLMGQPWEEPPGPDGWPEAAEDWITPQGMAARIDWAVRVPVAALDALPDPRDFVRTALGEAPPERVVFAAGAAEDRVEGIAVILASPQFNRR